MAGFKLQPVLNYRKLLKDVASQEYSEQLSEERRLKGEAERERERLEELFRMVEQRRLEGIEAQELWMLEDAIRYQDKKLGVLREELARSQQRTEEKRSRLTEAGRGKTLMERLKEAHEDREEKLFQQKERTETDEVAILFHNR